MVAPKPRGGLPGQPRAAALGPGERQAALLPGHVGEHLGRNLDPALRARQRPMLGGVGGELVQHREQAPLLGDALGLERLDVLATPHPLISRAPLADPVRRDDDVDGAPEHLMRGVAVDPSAPAFQLVMVPAGVSGR
jgi:hypothetical protein